MKKQFRITINGKNYDVVAELMDEDTPKARSSSRRRSASSGAASAPPPQAAKPQAAPAGDGALPSPLAGKVVSVDVEVGQEVQAGDQVMTLEAMKMNTVVNSAVAGTVKEVLVTAGDGVDEGQPLMTIS